MSVVLAEQYIRQSTKKSLIGMHIEKINTQFYGSMYLRKIDWFFVKYLRKISRFDSNSFLLSDPQTATATSVTKRIHCFIALYATEYL